MVISFEIQPSMNPFNKNVLRWFLLGAIDGLIVGLILYLILWLQSNNGLDQSYTTVDFWSFSTSELFDYRIIPLYTTVLFATCSAIIHCIIKKSPNIVLIWQYVGALATTLTVLFSVLIIASENISAGRKVSITSVFSFDDFQVWSQVAFYVSISNLIFALAFNLITHHLKTPRLP